MPVDSLQISGMVGGQQVMFANQAAYAQNISNQYLGTQAPTSSLQNPFPNPGGLGTSVVGGMGNALPGIAAGGAMLAGLAGGPLGMLDPFTAVPGAFRAGTGAASGAGVFGTLGHIGKTFATRGLGAGMGAVGGGLAAAALPAAGFYAASKGIEYVGSQIYQGAQNIGAVEDITQRVGPMWGSTGARSGGRTGHRQIQAMTNMLEEMTSQDSQLAGTSLVQLLDKAERHGLFAGSVNPQQITQKFKKMVDQVKNISQVLGTTIDEAMPLLGSMQRMGMWSTQDVMGTSLAMKTVGSGAAPSMMQTMQSGSQMSWARGGTLAQGARAGREAFMGVQSAMGAGVLSPEMLREMTGGVGGVEGQRMLATQMTGAMQNMAETSIGNLTLAALGQQEDGRFTGRLDPELLRRYRAGGLGLGEMKRLASAKTRGRGAQTSFHTRRGRIGQALASEGGMAGMSQMLSQVIEGSGYSGAGEDEQEIIIQQITGMDQRSAEFWRQMMDELPRIGEERNRRVKAAAGEAVHGMLEGRNRSFQELKNVLSTSWEKAVGSPLRKFSGEMVTQFNQQVDTFKKSLLQGASDLLVGGGTGGEMMGAAGVQMGSGGTTLRSKATLIERMRTHGFSGAVGMLSPGAGRLEGVKPLLGGLQGTKESDINLAARRAQLWAGKANLEDLGFSDDVEKSEAFATLKREASRLVMGVGPLSPQELRDLRDSSSNESEYQALLMSKLSPEGRAAMSKLAAKGRSDENWLLKEASLFSQAVKQGGAGEAAGAVDYRKIAEQTKGLTREYAASGLSRQVRQGQKDVADILSSAESQSRGLGDDLRNFYTGAAKVALTGLSMGAATPKALSALAGDIAVSVSTGSFDFAQSKEVIGDVFSGEFGLAGAFGDVLKDVTEEDVMSALQSEWGEDFIEYAQTGTFKKGSAFEKAVAAKDPIALKMTEALGRMKGSKDLGKFTTTLKQLSTRTKDLKKDTTRRAQTRMAKSELARLEKSPIKLSDEAKESYQKVLKAFESGEEGAMGQLEKLGTSLSGKDIKQLAVYGGAMGRYAAGRGVLESLTQQGEMSTGQFRKRVRQAENALGYDIESALSDEERAQLKEMQKGGMDPMELIRAQSMMMKAQKKKGLQEGSGESKDEKLLSLLSGYTEAQTNFVNAVGNAIPKMQGQDKKTLSMLEQLSSFVGSQTPETE